MLFTDLSSERIVKVFLKASFRIIKQGKQIGMSNGIHRITIPRHSRVNPFTLKGIVKDAGLTDQQFKDLL